MPRLRMIMGRRVGPWGLALTVWDIWRRIPPRHRKRLVEQARHHGPRLARQAYEARRRTPRRKP
ncbi:MAG TPA: hypothetical protein VGJ77_16330 [Gaiellaceae bacterium]